MSIMTFGNASTGAIGTKQHFVLRVQEPLSLNLIGANTKCNGVKRKAGMKPAKNRKPLISKHFHKSIPSELTVILNTVKNLYLIDVQPKFSLERFFITFSMKNYSFRLR